MLFGLDIDGVMTDFHDYNVMRVPKFFDTYENINHRADRICKKLGNDDYEYDILFWSLFRIESLLKTEFRKDARRATEEMERLGIPYIVITNRLRLNEEDYPDDDFSREAMEFHREFIKRNTEFIISQVAPNPVQVIYNQDKTGTKIDLLKKYGVTHMIDDEVHNIIDMNQYASENPNFHVYKMITPYNEDLKLPHVYNLNGWGSLIPMLSLLKNRSEA